MEEVLVVKKNSCGLDVSKSILWRRAEYTVLNVQTTMALFRANTSSMAAPASLLVIVTSYYPHHAKADDGHCVGVGVGVGVGGGETKSW